MSAKHTSLMRWDEVSGDVSGTANELKEALIRGEENYQELLEVYQYAGGTAQGLADLLFKETWENRTSPGTKAQMTYDVTTGEVTNVTIVVAGTGYTDGTDYTLTLIAGNNDAVISYDVVGGAFTNAAVVTGGSGYADGTGQDVLSEPEPGGVPDTQANADEVAMAQDAIDAMTAVHQLYQAATNNTVSQADRLATLRRMA